MKVSELFEKEEKETYVGFGDNLEALRKAIEGPFDEAPKGQTFEEFKKWMHEKANS